MKPFAYYFALLLLSYFLATTHHGIWLVAIVVMWAYIAWDCWNMRKEDDNG